jgi:hypothetical protein
MTTNATTTAKPANSTDTVSKASRKDGRQTKRDTVVKLLRRPKGASVADLQKATGWQPHSIRAALTGLRKRGHEIAREKDDSGVTRYRITREQ